MKLHFFTLTELVAVLAIMLIVGGLVVGQIGKVPAFASLEKSVGEVERLFSYASYVAVTRGKEVVIVYERENQEFRMAEAAVNTEEDAEEENPPANDSTRKYLNDKYGTMRLNSGIQMELVNVDVKEKSADFRCFPDGSASGPQMKFTLNKHTMKIRISPLTGAILREEVTGE